MKSIFRRLTGKSTRAQSAAAPVDNPSVVELENLEPRLLFSAAPVETPAETETAGEPQAAEEAAVVTAQAAQETAVAVESAESTQESRAANLTVAGQTEVPADRGVNLVNLNPGVEEVHRETLEAVADAAADRWRATGLTAEQSAALENIQYVVEDLGGPHLGFAEGMRITIDDNAAGNLWFIDHTPMVDEEYTTVGESGTLFTANGGTLAAGKTDLLTVIMHEQGNILGLEDSNSGADDLMLGVLGYNYRVLPAEGQAGGAVLGSVESSYLDSGVAGSGADIENRQPFLGVNYAITLQGIFPTESFGAPVKGGGEGFSEGTSYIGEIQMFGGNFAPVGTSLAQGQILSISSNTALFSILGTTYGGDGQSTFALPDLRGRTPIGVGTGPGLDPVLLGQKSGDEMVNLAANQIPVHGHTGLEDTTAGGQSHTNAMPTLGLNYIVSTQGTYPLGLGKMGLFAGNFAPAGTEIADGQLLQISSFNALFSLLGTSYGGDGESTFALPDLRGRVAVNAGNGTATGGLNLSLGEQAGQATNTVTTANLPSHTHTLPTGDSGATGDGVAYTNAQPTLAVTYMVQTSGIFPSEEFVAIENFGGGGGSGASFDSTTLGGIFMHAARENTLTAIVGGSIADANGTLISISSNNALFSIFGTTFGGDGEMTFGLPDLRGRAAVGTGQLNGNGTNYTLGQTGGSATTTLTVAQMAAHSHVVPAPADSTAPTVTSIVRQNPTDATTNADQVTFRVTFDEDVQNVDVADFVLSGTAAGDGTVGAPSVVTSSSVYDVTITGLTNSNGTINLDFAGGQNIEDLAGNALANTTPGSENDFTLDNTAPAVTSILRETPMVATTNADQVTFRVTFDEDVQNVDVADFALSGTAAGDGTIGAPSAVTGTSVYDVIVTGLTSSDGTINLDFAGGQNIEDLAGNALANTSPGSENDFTLDNSAPALTAFTRNNPATSPTNSDTLVFDITFDETVTNVDAADFDITGTTAAGVLAGSGAAYTLTLSGGDLAGLNGAVGLNLAGGQNIADTAGNALGAGEPATDETFALDNSAPALTAFARNNPATSPTNSDTLVFDITFDEAVTNVDAADFDITGTTAAGVLAGSGAAYTLTLSGGDLAGLNGAVGLNLAGGQNIADTAGNALGAGEPATDETFALDNSAPALTAFARNNPATSPTNSDTLVFDITFDGAVTNVDAADFDITGTTAAGVLAGSGAAYTLTLSGGDLAGLNGAVGLNLAGGQNIADTAGNALGAGEPATDETFALDNSAPALTAFARNNPATSPTNSDTLVFDITFDEVVTNVDATDFSVTGTTASGVLAGSGAAYTLTLSGGDLSGLNGTVGLNLAGGQDIEDAVGNALGAGEPATDETYTLDNVAPTLTAFARNTPAGENTNADTLVFDITFDGAVTNVDATDFSVTGTTASGVLAGSGAAYTLTLSGGDLAGLNGTVGLNLAGGQNIEDAVGNALGAGEPATDETYNVSNDSTPPTLTAFARNTPAAEDTNADTLIFDITFDEAVTNVDATDFDITGTTATGTIGGSGANYTLTLSGGNLAGLNGTVGLNLAGGQNITDTSGNALGAGEPGTDETYTLDNIGPTPTLSGPAGPLTDLTPFNVTIGFGETMTDFVQGDITVVNGSVTSFTDNGSGNFTAEITPVAGGTLTVDVAADVATEGAGNGNLAAAQYSVTLNIPLGPNIAQVTGTDLEINAGTGGDTVNLTSDGTDLIIGGSGNDITGGAGTTTDPGTGDVRVPIAGLTSITLKTGADADTINIGDLTNFTGSLEIDGEGGNDVINQTGCVEVTGASIVSYTAEEIEMSGGSKVSTDTGDVTMTGTGAVGNAVGVQMVGAAITSNTGDVSLTGQGGDTSHFNLGIRLKPDLVTASSSNITTGGEINLAGTGGTAGVFGAGVNISGSNLTSTGSDPITISGGGTGGSLFNEGVVVNAGSTIDAGTGDLTITGTGSATGNINRGVFASGSELKSDGGDIAINGTGGSPGILGVGADLSSMTLSTTGAGTVTVTGTGAAGTVLNMGVKLAGTTSITSENGEIKIEGTSNGVAILNHGVQMATGATIESTGAGPVNISGTGGGGINTQGVELASGVNLTVKNGDLTVAGISGTGSGNKGVNLASATLTGKGSGNIVVTGSSNGSAIGNAGVLGSGATITTKLTGTGSITIKGTGAAGGTLNNEGVRMTGGKIETGGNGFIDIDGTGGGTASGNNGIFLGTSIAIETGGTGAINIDGTGGGGTNSNNGIQLSGASITTAGLLTMAGTGSAGTTGFLNNGFNIALSSTINGGVGSTIAGTGGGGTPYNHGVSIGSTVLTTNLSNSAPDFTGTAGGGATSKALFGTFFP